MKSRVASHPALVGLLAASCFAYGYWSSRIERPRIVSLPELPQFYNADGSVATLPLTAASKPLLFFLLSTDCAYCEDITPAGRALFANLHAASPQPARLYILSNSPKSATRAFLQEHDLDNIPVLYLDDAAILALNASAMPSTLLREPPGEAAYWDGPLLPSDIEQITRRLRAR